MQELVKKWQGMLVPSVKKVLEQVESLAARVPFRKKPNGLALIALAIVAIIFLLLITRPQPSSALRQIPPTRVEATIVTVTPVNPTRRFTGRIEPRYRANLRFEVSGRVSQVFADTGSFVRAGEAILALDDAEYRDRLKEAEALLEQEKRSIARDQAQLAIAAESLLLAEKEVDRLESIGTALASETALDTAKRSRIQLQGEVIQLQHAVDIAEQRLASRQVAVNRAERDLDHASLRAPFDGLVNQRFVSPGDFVSTATDAVQFIDINEPELVLHVPGVMVEALSLQQELTLYTDNQQYRGLLVAIQPDAEGQTATHQVRAQVLTEDALLPGRLMQADLPMPAIDEALVVPLSAVLSDDGEHVVFVIHDNKVERRPVRIGLREGDQQVLLSGVSAGEQLVSRDLAALVDGQEVVVISE